jgi:hypothetical protein
MVKKEVGIGIKEKGENWLARETHIPAQEPYLPYLVAHVAHA